MKNVMAGNVVYVRKRRETMTTSLLGMKQRMNNPQAQFDKEKIVTKYRRHRSLMVRLSLLLMLASVAVECEAEEATSRMSSLVLPQGVSYTLGPVMLTRALEQATSANKTGKTTSLQSREASNIKKTVGSGVESSTSSGHSSGYNLGGSIGGSSSGQAVSA